MTKEDYIKDLEGCEFHFLDIGIVGCKNGKLIDGGKLVTWYDGNDKKMAGDLYELPKCWAKACWLSNAIYEWVGIEGVSQRDAGNILVRMYS